MCISMSSWCVLYYVLKWDRLFVLLICIRSVLLFWYYYATFLKSIVTSTRLSTSVANFLAIWKYLQNWHYLGIEGKRILKRFFKIYILFARFIRWHLVTHINCVKRYTQMPQRTPRFEIHCDACFFFCQPNYSIVEINF